MFDKVVSKVHTKPQEVCVGCKCFLKKTFTVILFKNGNISFNFLGYAEKSLLLFYLSSKYVEIITLHFRAVDYILKLQLP